MSRGMVVVVMLCTWRGIVMNTLSSINSTVSSANAPRFTSANAVLSGIAVDGSSAYVADHALGVVYRVLVYGMASTFSAQTAPTRALKSKLGALAQALYIP
jgi:hypothetical protein